MNHIPDRENVVKPISYVQSNRSRRFVQFTAGNITGTVAVADNVLHFLSWEANPTRAKGEALATMQIIQDMFPDHRISAVFPKCRQPKPGAWDFWVKIVNKQQETCMLR